LKFESRRHQNLANYCLSLAHITCKWYELETSKQLLTPRGYEPSKINSLCTFGLFDWQEKD